MKPGNRHAVCDKVPIPAGHRFLGDKEKGSSDAQEPSS